MSEQPIIQPAELPPATDDPSNVAEDYEIFRPDGWKKRPTVMQILPRLVSGGVERGTVDIAQALGRVGWNSIVVSAGGAMVHEVERAGATHITLPVHNKNPLTWRRTFDQLVDLIYRENVDIVHARSRVPAWLGWRAARRNKVPFVTTFHGRYADSNPLKRLYNSVMVRGDRVIAISHYIGQELTRRYPASAEKLRIIPRGVDLELFDPDRVSAERLIKFTNEWRLPDGVPVIMLPGRVTRWKGHELLLDALTQLSDIDLHCLMVGSFEGKESYKAKLEARINQLGLTARVHIVGASRDMPAAYKLSDVVAAPSLDPEPFGRVMIEAQAMGRPVVAANHGGATETVIDGQTGFLFGPGNPDALAEGIRRALALSEAQRQAMSEAAISHARTNYSKHDMCLRTLSVYAEVLPDHIGARLA